MRRRPDRLYEAFDPDKTGIFTALAIHGVPWASTYDSHTLDDVYIQMYSGGKRPAPVVCRMVADSDGYLTDEQVSRLASMIWSMCGEAWTRVWALELSEYDPILNYDMREDLTDDIREKEDSRSGTTSYGRTQTRTDDLTDTYGTTDTRTDALSISRTGTDTTESEGESSTTSDTERSVYGLNSQAGVPSDEESGSTSGRESETVTLTHATTEGHTGTQTNARTGEDTHTGTQSQVSGGTDRTTDMQTTTESHSYTLTRKGNIGTMTTQDMIKQEREIREWKLFYDRVFPDVDRALTLSIY